ncbi:helix-turn-helix domain-containing protein [Nocardia sp. NPDC051321]|uniref:helix-turn-helix domain-containing protein n=1 Tax=Nocardia sp. NPDC051321 TaxID=3364323 RepID=UPI0037A7803E
MKKDRAYARDEPPGAQDNTNIGDVPTVLRRMLGSRLQQLRKERKLTQQDVGAGIHTSAPTISRIESGMVGLRTCDVIKLLEFYGVTDPEEHDRYLSLVRLGNRPGWWHRDSDSLPKGFELLNLESAARTIRCYEPAVVPELLQTPEYARAALRLRYPERPEGELDRLLEVRLRRQEILGRPGAPYLWILVEESALRRPIGGITVWRNQIERLGEAIQTANIVMHVVGDEVCGQAIAGSAFLYLRFNEPQLPDVVCVSQPTSTLYLESWEDIKRYRYIADLLAMRAARPSETASRLESLEAGPALPGSGTVSA